MNYNSIKLLVMVALCGLATTTSAYADVVIGLSPNQSTKSLKAQMKLLLGFTAKHEAGERITFMDAYHNQKIASFVIPEGRAYANNPNARLKAGQNGKALKKLLRFVKSPKTDSAHATLQNVIKLPQFVNAAKQYQRSDQKLDVVAIGSPFYHDPTDLAFSMQDGLVPSDGHLLAPRSMTVFSANQQARFKNMRVHMAYGEATVFENDRHQYNVRRLWSLFTTMQGAEFISYAPDLDTVLERVNDNAVPEVVDEAVKADSKRLEMIRFRDMQLSTSIYEAPLATEVLSEAEITHAQNVVVGLTWHNCQHCDLDLYLRPNKAAETLSFQRTKTAEGVYYKDFVDAPKTGYETIELHHPVNLKQVWIAINFYAGQAPQGVKAELRFAVNGKTYARQIHIKATQGNKGADVVTVQNGQSSRHTLQVKPMQFIKLALTEA